MQESMQEKEQGTRPQSVQESKGLARKYAIKVHVATNYARMYSRNVARN